MKTIEERAWENYPVVIKHHNLARIDINEEKRKMYIEIATGQKEIDIENTCKWLKKELRKLVMDELKDNFLENEFKFVLKSQIPEWLINFRKAMEKQE